MTTLGFVLIRLQQAAEAVEPPLELTAGSIAFMLLAMLAVTSLAIWCFARILGSKEHFDPDGTGPAAPPVEGKVEREGGL